VNQSALKYAFNIGHYTELENYEGELNENLKSAIKIRNTV